VQTGNPAGIAATSQPRRAAARPKLPRPEGDVIGRDAWGSVNSFAFTCAVVGAWPSRAKAFAALRASAILASAPEPIAMLATVNAYVLTPDGPPR